MSEPSANLDLTALNDALGDDDRQALAEGADKMVMPAQQKDSPPALSSQSSAAIPPAHTQVTATANVPAAPPPLADSGENHPDPNVRKIKAMFPDMDVDTIQAVLVADGGDFERGEHQSNDAND